MSKDQTRIFLDSEGDQYFRRNRAALERFDPEADAPMRLMQTYGLRPTRLLEIGCASGFRLAAVAEKYGAEVVGVEPSAEAIDDGRRRYPAVTFVQGHAAEVPLKTQFDGVVVNFVLHWVDRSRLLQAVAEIDRVLADGGFLILGDFSPANRIRTPYHHRENGEVFTYKQDYSALFVASGLYSLYARLDSDHSTRTCGIEVPEHDRVSHWLLRKSLDQYYSRP